MPVHNFPELFAPKETVFCVVIAQSHILFCLMIEVSDINNVGIPGIKMERFDLKMCHLQVKKKDSNIYLNTKCPIFL